MKSALLITLLIMGSTALAKKPTSSKPGPKLSTDHRFDGQQVGGKIQMPLESTTVVENEKGIDDLIGVRKNFNDRSEKAKGLR